MATKLAKHQSRAMQKALRKGRLALFHKMGRGKTLTALAALMKAWWDQRIECAAVFAPAYLKAVWRDEVEKHFKDALTDGLIRVVMVDGTRWPEYPEDAAGQLVIFIASIESLAYAKTLNAAKKTLNGRKFAMVIDEATAIKTPSAKRTRHAWQLGQLARLRLALTGTPITNGIENLYAIFRFLGPDIIGTKTYTAFKSRYCVMGGFQQKQVIGYRNKDELMMRIMPYADVQETNPDDFPQRLFQRIEVELTPQQKAALKDLRKGFLNLDPDNPEVITTALTFLLRAQQIIGGAFEEINPSPKHEALLELLEGIQEPVIIWFRFREELRRAESALRHLQPLTFHGDMSEKAKAESSRAFVDGKSSIMLTTYAGARGQTWIHAPYAIFFSRSFSYEDNEQAAARNWGRIGQEGQKRAVVYYDLIANHALDRLVHQNLKGKRELAVEVINYLKGGAT